MENESGKIKLFIVDNDKNVVNSISRSVKLNFNDEVDFSLSAFEAYDKVVNFNPDIIITDVNFNNDPAGKEDDLTTAGVTLSRKIKKHLPSVKIIAISGFRNDDEIFEKITEKDWYDVFHTKGSEDLYEKYAKLRNEVINLKTGLIPSLSKFFAPMNYGGDADKSFYRLLHTNYTREDNLKFLPQIEEFYGSFRGMLDPSGAAVIDSCIKNYKTRDLNDSERIKIKEAFHIKTNGLECLYNSIKTTIYAERSIIVELWEKIISETKDHGDIQSAKFSLELKDDATMLIVRQNRIFDFAKFIESKRTLSFYKKIRNYGDIIISSEDSVFSVVNENFISASGSTDGTEIKMILKTIPPR